jgi:hypothetical protein
MNLTRRRLIWLGALLTGPAHLSQLFGQSGKPHETLYPPEPDGQEFDVLRLYLRRSEKEPAMRLRERGQEFSNCLQRLLDTAANLWERTGRVPMSKVLSVQVYKQTELIERLAKQLKSLAKN